MKTLTESIRETLEVLNENENFNWQAYAAEHQNESVYDILISVAGGQANLVLLGRLANYFEEGFHSTFTEMIEEMPIVAQLGGADTDEGTEAGYAYYMRALEVFLLNTHGEDDPEKLEELVEHLEAENTDVNLTIPFKEIHGSIQHLEDYNF